MKTYVALLRGINVGGRNSLPMKELTEMLVCLDCQNISTYIQSGNVVFRSGKTALSLAKGVAAEVARRKGFEPHIFVLDRSQFLEAIENNPFSAYEGDPKSVHFGFLDTEPMSPDLGAIETLKAPTEQFSLVGRVFYLLAPDGVGRSKLAARAEKLIGRPMTDRNWNTVTKLKAMLDTPCS